MIYLDCSVLLAELFVEDRHPNSNFWRQNLMSSRLLQFEAINRIHALQLEAVAAPAMEMLNRIDLVEMSPHTLERALGPFPIPVRTLDGLHLATADYLRQQGHSVELASYDRRLCRAAEAMGFTLASL